jgi:hypothetical protein
VAFEHGLKRIANWVVWTPTASPPAPVAHQGGTREITVEAALQQRTFQDALAGKRMAQREVLKWIVKIGWRSMRRKRRGRRLRDTSRPIRTTPMKLSCFSGSQHRILPVRTLSPTWHNYCLSLGRFRRLSAAGAAATA